MHSINELNSQRVAAWIIPVVLLTLVGCANNRWNPRQPFASLMRTSAKIPAEATKEEIVAYVNAHVEPIHGWSATNSSVKATGIPMRLSSTLAVEQPNHIRMVVSNPLSGQSEMELGSNPDHIWFWMNKMDPKAIVTCRHEEIAAVQDNLPVPFQPDWLLEVLCVRPIDGTEAELLRDPDDPYTVKLVNHHTSETGNVVRKISTISLRRGEIESHKLFDGDHRLLVSAELSDYRSFPNTKARLPHDIKLKWAQQDMTMSIALGGVIINPPNLPPETWQAPKIAGCEIHELHRDQLVRPDTAIVGHDMRPKPKAITQYEHDAPSGAWVQNQTIIPAGNSPAQTASVTPDQWATNTAAPFASTAQIAPVGGTNSSNQTAPPFPDFASPPASNGNRIDNENPGRVTLDTIWTPPPPQKRSRDTLTY